MCATSASGVWVRSAAAPSAAAPGAIAWPSARSRCSMPATTASASAARPWVISQRGLSGSHSRMKNTMPASSAPIRNAARQPCSGSITARSSSTIAAERAERRADPERAVDHEVGPAAHARRDQLLDGGIDRRVFAADARAGDEAEEQEAPQIPRERGRGGRQQVDGERDEEQLLAPEPVGEPAEEDRAQHRAGEIRAARKPDIGIAEAAAPGFPSARPRPCRRASPRARRGSR